MNTLVIEFFSVTCNPANMRRWPNVGLLLAHRLRRWPNSKLTLGQRLVYAGKPYLRAPLNKQATNNPGSPGRCRKASITYRGNNCNTKGQFILRVLNNDIVRRNYI